MIFTFLCALALHERRLFLFPSTKKVRYYSDASRFSCQGDFPSLSPHVLGVTFSIAEHPTATLPIEFSLSNVNEAQSLTQPLSVTNIYSK